MDYVEIEGSNVEEAIEAALEQLGVTREEAAIEIISDTAKGLFGFGGRRARVRARRCAPVGSAREALPAARPPENEAPPAAVPVSETSASTAAAARDPLQRAREILEEILCLMRFQVHVRADPAPEHPQLTITGAVPGSLIGRRGQTLDALEYLVNRMTACAGDLHARISIDAADYRARRTQSLQDLAHRMAHQARRRGRAVTLNPMSPRDRRIVHMALQEESTLITQSFGEGRFRQIRIIPKPQRSKPSSKNSQ